MTISETAFSEGYTRCFFRTEAFLRSRGLNPTQAEELAQAAWSKGWESRHQLQDAESLLPWVNTIALNLVRKAYRTSLVLKEIAIESLPLAGEPFESPLAASLDLNCLLRGLRPRDCALIERCYISGSTTAEASAECGATPLALRLRMHRALSRARRLLTSGGRKFALAGVKLQAA